MEGQKRQVEGWRRLRARLVVQEMLTPAELEIVKFIILGYNSSQIATLTNRSVRTIEAHRSNIRDKLYIDKYQNWRIIQWALESGLITINF